MAAKKKKPKSRAKWTKGRKLAVKKCARNGAFFSKKSADQKKLTTYCCPAGKWSPRRKKKRWEGGLKPHLLRTPKKR